MSRRSANAYQLEANSRVYLSFLFLLFFLANCSSSGSGDILTLDARQGSSQKKIAAAEKDQNFLAIPFSAPDTNPSEEFTYDLRLEYSNSTSSEEQKINLFQSLNESSLKMVHALLRRMQNEAIRHKQTQAHLLEASNQRKTRPAFFRKFFKKHAKIQTQQSSLPSSLSIFSPFSGEENASITGTLRANSNKAAIYVDSRFNSTVSDSRINQILNAYDQISLPRLHAIFGQETDIDENNVIIVFLSSPEKIGTDVVGFFRPLDLLPDGAVSGLKSNEGEFVYARTPGEGFDLEVAHATIAHETFHLINFSEKSIPLFQQTNGTLILSESIFLNEGQAHLAEDLVGWGVCTALLTKIYLDCMQHTSLAGPGNVQADSPCATVNSEGDSLPRRGGAMLLLLYIFQQLGGATYSTVNVEDVSGDGVAFLRALNTSIKTGIENLKEASGRDFFSWYGDFTAMLALDNTGQIADSRYNLDAEVPDSFTNLLRNIRLRTTRTDSTGTITLNGPTILGNVQASINTLINGSLFSSGANVLGLTIPANQEITLTIQSDTALSLGLTLVRIQ